MQDDGVVGWDPVSVEHHLPWQERVLILFLLVIGIVILAKLSWLIVRMWRARRAGGKQDGFFQFRATLVVNSIKSWLKLTLLATALGVSSTAANLFREFSTQKITSWSVISGALSELLVCAELGVIIATAGFVGCMACDSWIRKRMLEGQRSSEEPAAR